jgi:hypothetical protein
VGLALQKLNEALDELADMPDVALGDGETLQELERLLARHESIVARSAASFDASGEWTVDGAKSATMWITVTCNIPKPTARRHVHLGRALRQLPVCDGAFRRGEITGAHVEQLAKLCRPTTGFALLRDEALLVGHAKKLRFDQFVRALRYWEQHADPDGVERTAEAQRAERDAWLVSSFDGMYLGKMTLDPISGAIVSHELERIEQELFELDWAKAKEELGREPTVAELGRTPAQRRADAFCDMAIRSATAPADGRRPDPLFTVLVGYETMQGRICQLAQGAALTPGSLVPWLTHAYIESAIFELGRRVEVSERARFFTGATRRGLEVRDQECTHPLCDEQAERCEADHIQPFSEGGLTVQENGRILCGFHNRQRNQRRQPRPPPDG